MIFLVPKAYHPNTRRTLSIVFVFIIDRHQHQHQRYRRPRNHLHYLEGAFNNVSPNPTQFCSHDYYIMGDSLSAPCLLQLGL